MQRNGQKIMSNFFSIKPITIRRDESLNCSLCPTNLTAQVSIVHPETRTPFFFLSGVLSYKLDRLTTQRGLTRRESHIHTILDGIRIIEDSLPYAPTLSSVVLFRTGVDGYIL